MSDHLCTSELKHMYPATAIAKTRIGILGGTFNPVHKGHIQMGADAHDEFGLSKVFYIPTGRPPHKADKTIAENEHRLAMLDIAMDYPYMQSSSIEIDRKGTTYTVDTLTALKNVFKEHEFYYIIGSDTLMVLDTWKNIDQVLTLTNFIVFLRQGDDPERVKNTIAFYNNATIKCMFLADAPGLPISSSDIRFRILNGLDLSGHLDKGVIDYIKENNVY